MWPDPYQISYILLAKLIGYCFGKSFRRAIAEYFAITQEYKGDSKAMLRSRRTNDIFAVSDQLCTQLLFYDPSCDNEWVKLFVECYGYIDRAYYVPFFGEPVV